ncbi:hypothetical protein Tco_0328926 [Tanacetum coccineum]
MIIETSPFRQRNGLELGAEIAWRGLSEMIPITLNCASRGIPELAHQPTGLQDGLGGPVRDSRVSSSKTLLGSVVEDFGLLCTAPSDRELYRTPSGKACCRNLDQTSPTPVSEFLSKNNNNITACRVYRKSFYTKELNQTLMLY